jgi:hypothetical protein
MAKTAPKKKEYDIDPDSANRTAKQRRERNAALHKEFDALLKARTKDVQWLARIQTVAKEIGLGAISKDEAAVYARQMRQATAPAAPKKRTSKIDTTQVYADLNRVRE